MALVKLRFIGLIVLLISPSIGAPLAFADGSIGPISFRKELVEKTIMYVIVANVNSPWNGKATYAKKTYFHRRFDTLLSISQYVSFETSITASDGENIYMARLADAAVYDVYLGDSYLDVSTLVIKSMTPASP